MVFTTSSQPQFLQLQPTVERRVTDEHSVITGTTELFKAGDSGSLIFTGDSKETGTADDCILGLAFGG
jgi:hypothetical protein